jgi:signal transduction histidine kinase
LGQTRVHILIVDADHADREACQRAIAGWPDREAVFSEVASAEEALQVYRAEHPDCIVLDYQLPDRDGLELLRALQGEEGASAPLPAVMLTGHGNESVAAEALRLGAQDYCVKGRITPEGLRRAVDRAIEKVIMLRKIEGQRRELESANRDLRRMNDEIWAWYRALAHELKTPLSSAREFLAIQLDGVNGPLTEEQFRQLTLAKESCNQMAGLIDDLFDVARLDTGRMTVKPTPASMGDMVGRVLNSMAVAAKDKGIHLKCEVEPGLPQIPVDEHLITQVITNLLNNALKFTPKGGEVVVTVRASVRSQESILVSVSDTGCGIEKDHLERIFDRLYQINSNGSLCSIGLGLGLAICRESVKLHNGEIWAESEPGKGSTFSFTIPISRGTEQFAGDAPAESRSKSDNDPHHRR